LCEKVTKLVQAESARKDDNFFPDGDGFDDCVSQMNNCDFMSAKQFAEQSTSQISKPPSLGEKSKAALTRFLLFLAHFIILCKLCLIVTFRMD